jgi:hypothetical protein
MNPWSKRPGKKVSVPRFSLESWAQHMADPSPLGTGKTFTVITGELTLGTSLFFTKTVAAIFSGGLSEPIQLGRTGSNLSVKGHTIVENGETCH